MRGLWERWVARLDATEPAFALAVVRILLALTILSCLVHIGVSGVLPLLWHDRAHGGMRDVAGTWWLVRLLGGPGTAVVHGVYALAVTGASCLLLGIGGRVTPLVLGQLMMALFSLNPDTGGGHDRVMTCALFVLGFSGAAATLSLPARLATGRWLAPVMVPSWPRWVLFYQLGIIYTSTGLQKVDPTGCRGATSARSTTRSTWPSGRAGSTRGRVPRGATRSRRWERSGRSSSSGRDSSGC